MYIIRQRHRRCQTHATPSRRRSQLVACGSDAPTAAPSRHCLSRAAVARRARRVAPAAAAAPAPGGPHRLRRPRRSAAAGAAASVYDTPLTGVCPDTVVFQTNWWPEADHGWPISSSAPNGTVDPAKNTYTGPARRHRRQPRDPGRRSGRRLPAVTAQMYQDDSILLGMVGTDERSARPRRSRPRRCWPGTPRTRRSSSGATPSGTSRASPTSASRAPRYWRLRAAPTSTSSRARACSTRSRSIRRTRATRRASSPRTARSSRRAFVTAEPYIYEHEVAGRGSRSSSCWSRSSPSTRTRSPSAPIRSRPTAPAWRSSCRCSSRLDRLRQRTRAWSTTCWSTTRRKLRGGTQITREGAPTPSRSSSSWASSATVATASSARSTTRGSRH